MRRGRRARHGGPLALRALDQPLQERQPGLLTHGGDAQACRARSAGAAGEHRIAGDARDRAGLAGEQRFVEIARREQVAIGRHRFAGCDVQHVAGGQHPDRHAFPACAALARRERRPRARQQVDLFAGALSRPLLELACGEQ